MKILPDSKTTANLNNPKAQIPRNKNGPTRIRTEGARFKVWSDNLYTIGPLDTMGIQKVYNIV